jgi:cytochrome P450
MPFTYIARRLSGDEDELPPAAPLPAALQTLACRFWPLQYFELCRTRYGDRFTVRPVDMPPLVLLANPREIRAVLTAPTSALRAGAGGEVAAPLFGDHSFMLRDGEEHMCGRSAILPAFHRRAIANLAEHVTEIVTQEVGSWPVGEPFPVYPHLRSLTLAVIVKSLFKADRAELQELHGRLLEMLSIMAGLLLQEPRLRHLPGWHGPWRRFRLQRDEVHRLIGSLIAGHRNKGSGNSDLLDMLISANNPDGSAMSDVQVRDNLLSVLIAGHETTASELAWAFQLLAHNPAVQHRLSEAIDSDGGEAYLTATINEVLRHRPVFPFAGPRVVVDAIEIGGWMYRAPTRLLPCIYLVHHDPQLYPRPDRFSPERFLGASPAPRIWLPWGGGRKHCVGQHLALLEMRTVLRATLLTRQVLPAAKRIEHARWRSVLVTPHAGSRIVLSRRRSSGPRRRAPRVVQATA